jgi:hypothetical protein
MQVRRREFLGALVAGAAIYGLDRFAFGGDEKAAPKAEAPPKWFKDALAEMKATKSPGVAIVLPDGKDARATLLAELQTLLRQPTIEAQTHLVEAVYVVALGVHAGAKADETLVLLDADGKRVAGSTAKLTAATFAASVRPLLRDGDRFATRAKAARTPEVEKLLDALDDEDAEKVNKAVERLTLEFTAAGPAIIAACEASTDADVRGRLVQVIIRAFGRRRGDEGADAERPLPFGAKWKVGAIPMPEEDPCPPCGMMRIPPRSHDLLEFLAKDPPEVK